MYNICSFTIVSIRQVGWSKGGILNEGKCMVKQRHIDGNEYGEFSVPEKICWTGESLHPPHPSFLHFLAAI